MNDEDSNASFMRSHISSVSVSIDPYGAGKIENEERKKKRMKE